MRTLRHLLLASAAFATPVAAQAQDRGVQVLLDQANYWRSQNRPDQVLRTLERVLSSDPNNADALAGAAQAQAEQGNRAAADQYLARLRQQAPADPRLGRAELAVRGASIDPAQLAETRRLAQAGQQGTAVTRYRELFRGTTPPDAYAVEYYQALAGTQEGYAEARNGLARLAERNPNDRRLQLAYAQVLTWREGSREEGIRRLRQLSQNPDTAQAASAAWRDALSYQGSNPAAIPELENYLQRFPNDTAAQNQLAAARNPVRSPQDLLGAQRQEGFTALNAGRLAQAQQAFEAVLAQVPEDSDALGGLGIVRLRQGRNNDARQLLTRAIAADPQEGRRKWGQALAGSTASGEVNAARNQIGRGQIDQAEAALQQTVRRDSAERPDAETLLGDIALRRGDPAGAEQRYRAALARRPDLPGALSGLYEALQAQGRFAEAEELAARRGPAFAAATGAARAEQLRAEAQRSEDPATAIALLRGAQASNPNNPWVRLDLARALLRQGNAAEARAIVEEAAQTNASADNLYAAALFAQEEGRTADAARYVERIPDRLRNADQNRLLRTARLQREIAAAAEPARYGRPEDARRRLLEIAARPDPTGETAALAVRALSNVGDVRGAAEVARVAASVNRGAAPAGRIALADALLAAGQETEAAEIIRSLQSDPRLSADDRRRVDGLRTGVAVRTSDRLNERGDQASAYEQLLPALRNAPQDPSANLALARLYQGAREPVEAQRIAEAVLGRDPRNADARLAAADAALALRQWGRAETLLTEGQALMPNDPRISVLEARLARASGDPRRARAALERAAEQRRAQIGAAPPQEEASRQPTAATPLAPVSQNPFRRVALAGGNELFAEPPAATGVAVNDPLLNDISRQLVEVREEAAPRLTPSIGARLRTGSAGLDRLREVSGGGEVSTPIAGLGGRVAVRAQVYNIDSGDLNEDAGTLRRFGTNPLRIGQNDVLTAADSRAASPRSTTATGVAVGLGYTRPGFAADIGSTPLGFQQQNVVGGVEIAPELARDLRLRIVGERRAVTDSLLSWSGMRDRNGQRWGGVVRNTGRGQVEFSVGDTNFYVGGGYSSFEGNHVADNTRIEAGAGFSTPIFRRPDEELITGLDLVYQSYDKNLRLFTLGHGGYFSPQSYYAANLPVDYRARVGNWAYRLGGVIGVANYKEDAAPLFPRDPGLQAQAVATNPQNAFYAAQSATNLTGGLRADLEYSVTPSLRIGALLRYDRAADWNETRGMIFARYRLD
ncbi:cellulose synthase subunit BcsC-related outer membrane protein [Roseomonas sp. BN140053]|uniref:cellulose biosynthesis protein BcsC n=1 Tax=Roseomonas sp. BN140053 TaxID=3391898 RepID=UPI0039E7DA31